MASRCAHATDNDLVTGLHSGPKSVFGLILAGLGLLNTYWPPGTGLTFLSLGITGFYPSLGSSLAIGNLHGTSHDLCEYFLSIEVTGLVINLVMASLELLTDVMCDLRIAGCAHCTR